MKKFCVHHLINERWLYRTKDIGTFKNDSLYGWDTEMISFFDSVEDVYSSLLHFNVNTENVIVVPAIGHKIQSIDCPFSGDFTYAFDFTQSFPIHWEDIDEYCKSNVGGH